MLGKHLIEELSDGDIKIVCAMDRNTVNEKFKFPVIGTNDKVPEADAVIVTPSYEFSDIRKHLTKKGVSNVISIESLFE